MYYEACLARAVAGVRNFHEKKEIEALTGKKYLRRDFEWICQITNK
jgi:hypothetical protein